MLFDNRDLCFPEDQRISLVSDLCCRFSVDGVILVESSVIASVRMRIYNADGGEAEMCGNGIRCLYRYVQDLDISCGQITVETMERVLNLSESDGQVLVEMGACHDLQCGLRLNLPTGPTIVDYVHTGVPHVVLKVSCIKDFPLQSFAESVQLHPRFVSEGCNVNIFMSTGKQSLSLRTFERGVGETRACGTGACAAAISAYQSSQGAPPFSVAVSSGDKLGVFFTSLEGEIKDLTLSGPAERLSQGKISDCLGSVLKS